MTKMTENDNAKDMDNDNGEDNDIVDSDKGQTT